MEIPQSNHPHSLAISWVLTSIGTIANFINSGDSFLTIFISFPESTYDYTVKIITDILTIVCFIAAITASMFSIIEKRSKIKQR